MVSALLVSMLVPVTSAQQVESPEPLTGDPAIDAWVRTTTPPSGGSLPSTLHRAVVFCGTTSDDRRLDRIRAPVLGHYAGYDFQTTAQVLATKRWMG